jgi:tRNA(Arg) A34 adenosine deaminase TadA
MTSGQFLQRAVELSQEGMRQGQGGPFGALVVAGGEIIGQGCNRVLATHDPTAHAEIVAIRQACQVRQSFSLPDGVIYTSCEPCPMCLSAIYWAGIQTVYYANTRHDAAGIGFIDEELYGELARAPEQRRLSMVRMLLPEALAAFEEWRTKADKVRY